MTPEALTALKDSIAHWERKVADPENEPIGRKSCALCIQFIEDGCVGCPVKSRTGRKNCEGTPYIDVSNAQWEFEHGYVPLEAYIYINIFRAKCQLELDFLKSLLPKEEAK